MKTSQEGVNLIKSFEGLETRAYVCPAGILTVGYGHTGPDVYSGQIVSVQQAEQLLKDDLGEAEKAVNDYVKVSINQNQFDALVSFTFNVGTGAFESSTLLKRLNSKENPCTVAKEELPRWAKGSGNEVLQGLLRRRSAEVEMFCSTPAEHLTGMVDITTKQQTWLKKEPVQADQLSNDNKAKMYQGRTIRNCKILDHKESHTQLELGFGLGTWWVFDAHWSGLTTTIDVTAATNENGFRCLRNFPYFYQQDNGPEGWRQCQSSSVAMVLKYLDVKGINDDVDYLKYVNKYGDTTARIPHINALKDLNVSASFRQNLDAQDVKDQIDKGLPVVAGILHHGSVSAPRGGGHFIVITGYSDTDWLVQDPYGELDLVNGVWLSTTSGAGKNQKYSFQNMNPRFFYGGNSNGWGWVDFKYAG